MKDLPILENEPHFSHQIEKLLPLSF